MDMVCKMASYDEFWEYLEDIQCSDVDAYIKYDNGNGPRKVTVNPDDIVIADNYGVTINSDYVCELYEVEAVGEK